MSEEKNKDRNYALLSGFISIGILIVGLSVLFLSVINSLKQDMVAMENRLDNRMDRLETDINEVKTEVKGINEKLNKLLYSKEKHANNNR